MRSAVLLVLALAVAVPGQAQVKAGSEFRANTRTAGDQYGLDLAAQAGGDFVVVWSDSYPTRGVFAQRFDARGAAQGAAFQLNSHPNAGGGYYLSVDADRKGDFVVVWVGGLYQTGYGDVVARRFDREGRALGREFLVNTATSGLQWPNDLAMAPGGEFVVAWMANSQGFDALARRYDARGMGQGDEFRINAVTTSFQAFPSVGMTDDGSFVATYEGYGEAGDFGLFARRYGRLGDVLGSEFRVNTSSSGMVFQPELRMAPDRTFVVSWAQSADDPFDRGAFVRRFDADGTALGPELRVDSGGLAAFPRTTFDASGRFVVTWTHNVSGLSGYEVRARRFDAQGVPLGPEFHVNTYTTGKQYRPAVASDAVGNFVVVWTSEGQGQGKDLYAQRFGGLLPAALAVDDGGNGVLDVSESAVLRTRWRNVNGAAQTFTGASSHAAAPPGLTLSLSPQAAYGTVADGAEGTCATCFTALLSGTRPAGHVDASFRETIQPVEQGQAQGWALHVGGSFVDVPAASPYSRFVETLLHRSITGGCGGLQYCPGASISREQMAVFVLAAKEGTGYAPPACTTPVFSDVPAASPSCRWVEELVRRGVTNGCGGGRFCPADPVTREQMAVFLLRTLDPTLSPQACTTPVFGDVPASSGFCRWIEELVRRGVTAGCGGGNYCPAQAVTREQMAVFLTTTFGLTLYGP